MTVIQDEPTAHDETPVKELWEMEQVESDGSALQLVADAMKSRR